MMFHFLSSLSACVRACVQKPKFEKFTIRDSNLLSILSGLAHYLPQVNFGDCNIFTGVCLFIGRAEG